jgi:hypothetical protein
VSDQAIRRIATYKRTKGHARWCRKVKERAGAVCERRGGRCGAEHLTVHHILESRIYPEFARESLNVLILCEYCHGEIARAEHEGTTARLWFYASLPPQVRTRHVPFLEQVLGPEQPLVAALRAGNSDYWNSLRVRDLTR